MSRLQPAPRSSQLPELTVTELCRGGGLLLLSWIGAILHLSIVLELPVLMAAYAGPTWQRQLVELLGGKWSDYGPEPVIDAGLFGPLLLVSLLGGLYSLVVWQRQPHPAGGSRFEQLFRAGTQVALWSLPLTAWSGLWLCSSLLGLTGLQGLLASLQSLVAPLTLAGWFYLAGQGPPRQSADWSPRQAGTALLLLGGLSVVVWAALNWGLWFNLRLPHGDSAMYEEHLWNLWHGKGFRSYLDQGLFLGEHIQVIHIGLLPLHLLWPSHLLLELCESLALASAVVPIYQLARQHHSSRRGAALLAAVYLSWFGLHYLDIAIDLKTFRPNVFGVPIMLWWLLALERQQWFAGLGWWLLLLTCQEDYTLVTAPVGLWLACTGWQQPAATGRPRWLQIRWGLSYCVLSAAYLLIVMKVLLPYFRSGVTIHYASYFSAFGETPQEIIANMLLRPDRTLALFATPGALLYALYLLTPLGGLPLLSPGRLLTSVPLFILLTLNELVQTTPGPFHHFHAPIVPILFWAAAAGLSYPWAWNPSGKTTPPPAADGQATGEQRSRLALCCALCTAIVFSLSPLGLRFWDAERGYYWQELYIPGERPRQFEKIYPLIPQSARVASTDFIHPRFTHHERSYDYSDYPRAVADYEDRVPHDTDFIVLDLQHPYSRIRSLQDPIRELVREPEHWEVWPDSTNGYFLILQRKSPPAAAE